MSVITLSVVIVFIFIALVAATIAGVMKLIFFRKQANIYSTLLKFSLLGESIGVIVMYVILYLHKLNTIKWDEPESAILFPFYFMIAGLIVGTIFIYSKQKLFD